MIIKVVNRPMSIKDLYDCVAIVMGYNPNDCKYDCTKINVAENIADNVEDFYKNKGADIEFGMAWVCYGPKTDDSLSDCEVEVEDGFLIFKKEN